MSDNEPEVLSQGQSIEIVGESERDHAFFDSLRVPSITKETIINLSSDRIKEVRSQISQFGSTVIDLRSTVTDLRSTVAGLRQAFEQATRAADEASETINLLETQLRISNETIEELKTELTVRRSDTVPSDNQSVNMNPSCQNNNNSTSSSIIHNHQPSATLNVHKPTIKAAQPESFSGERVRQVNDWLAAVKRYLVLSAVEENKWVAYTTTMLTSTALNWWNSVESSNRDKTILDYSWNEFVDLVRERFVPVDNEVTAMSKMSQWRQTGSVAVYISQFQSFDQIIPKERLDEEMRVQMFIQGLKPECKPIISMWEPKTLHQAYKMAQKFDNGLRQNQQKFNYSTSTRVARTQISDQQEGTRNNPITFNNTELQTEIQDEDGHDNNNDLNQMNDQNVKRYVCFFCKSPDHFQYACPKLKKRREGQSMFKYRPTHHSLVRQGSKNE
jgi:hypothetical protein